MYVEDITLRSSPGLTRPLHLKGLTPGLILLVGPNASGKSTLARLLRGTLWPDQAPASMDAKTRWRQRPGAPPLDATLVFGRTHWQGEAPQVDQGASSSWQLTLRTLLATDGASDQAIAAAIQRELDGGYDLDALEANVARRQRPTPAHRKAMQASSRLLRALLDATDGLQDDEARLVALRRQASAAANAHGRLVDVDEALRRLAEHAKLTEIVAQRRAVPEHVTTLPADAATRALELIEAAQQAQDEADRRKQIDEQQQAVVADLVFPRGDPGQSQTDAWLRDAEGLVVDGQALRVVCAQADSAQATVAELTEQVWSDPAVTHLPGREALARLADVARQLIVAEAVTRSLETTLNGSPPAASVDAKRRAALAEARRLLMQWLTTPREVVQVAPPTADRTWTTILLIAGACLGLFGAVVALGFSVWLGLPLVGAGLGLGGVSLGLWLSPRLAGPAGAGDDRSAEPSAPPAGLSDVQRRYARTGVAAPPTWTFDSVQDHLAAIENDLAAAEQDTQVAAARARIDQQLVRARAGEDRFRRAQEDAAEAFGLAAELPPLALLVQADRVVALANGQADLAVAISGRDQLTAAVRGRMTTLRQAMVATRCPEVGLTLTPNGLLRAARSLAKRRADWHAVATRRATAQAEANHARTARDAAVQKRDEILRTFNVTPTTVMQLPARLVLLRQWQALGVQEAATRQALAELDARLPADLPDDETALRAERARLGALAEQQTQLHAEISDIEHDLRLATDGSDVQTALRARDAANDVLVASRDAALADHATRALVTWLRGQRSPQRTPAMLRRARRWFLRFTRNRYELQVGPSGRFQAMDLTTQRLQSLAELSSGTRVQLLLAARVAFMEHSEAGGSPLPLFLDEVLSTTDPERFSAIATAVLELTQPENTGSSEFYDDQPTPAVGRQVFYATADPAEAQRWVSHAAAGGFDPPQVHTLGGAEDDVHDDAERWTSAPALAPPPTARADEPTSADPIAYTRALGLPRPGLHDPAARWPLALVLQDHLHEVWQAAHQGLTVAGQLRLQSVPLPLADEHVALAQARTQAIAATLAALRIGRGKPVTWAVVEQSAAVSATFQDRVRLMLEDHRDDATAFVAAVAKVSRFRAQSVQQLRTHLEAVGCIDSEPPLTTVEVVDRVTTACASALSAGHLSLADVPRWATFVADVVGCGTVPAGGTISVGGAVPAAAAIS